MPFKAIDRDQLDLSDNFEAPLTRALGRYSADQHRIVVRGSWPDGESGANPLVVLHESIHGAMDHRIEQGLLDRKAGMATPIQRPSTRSRRGATVSLH